MIARSLATHPKILVLNDPARGIDVSTKRDLYTHLRKFVEEGNTVIFLSSELEEFIGLCPKVIVFRNGTIFDVFKNEKVNADTLLAGMFGQTTGIGSTSISGSNDRSISGKLSTTSSNLRNIDVQDKKIIKILDFDKEKKSKENNLEKKNKGKNILMKTANLNNYYTGEDLIHFKKLKNFNDSKVNKLTSNQTKCHPVRYALSDKTHFDKIINIDNVKNSLPKKIEKTKKNKYYNSLDIKNFEKINQLTTFSENKPVKKSSEVIKTTTNYTANDESAFDQIIKSKADVKKNNEDKIISKIDNKKIKIIDFSRLKEREKILKNKFGIEKIKIVYFS